MTIGEAINHCDEIVKDMTNVDVNELGQIYADDTECILEHMTRCAKCAEEHRQLAKWLRDYQRLLEMERQIKSVLQTEISGYKEEQEQLLSRSVDDVERSHGYGIMRGITMTENAIIKVVAPEGEK